MTQLYAFVDPNLPWDPYPGENRRLRILLIIMLFLALLIITLVHFVKVPVVDRAKAEALPDNLATVVLEQKKLPPPPPPPKKEEVKKEDKADENAAKKEEVKPKEEKVQKPVEQVEPKAVQMDAKTTAARARAREALKDSGLDDLASLRDMATPEPKLSGSPDQTGAGTGGLITDTKEAGTSRNLISSRAGGYSGAAGAYSGGASEGFGGGKAGGRGSKGGAGGNGFGLGGGSTQAVKTNIVGGNGQAAGAHEKGAGGKMRRNAEDIRRVFDASATGRMNNAYQRALRDNPSMQGAVHLKLAISPDGAVTSCSVESSELNFPELEGKICVIVKGLKFDAGDFEPFNGSHTVNFFPN